MIAPNFIPTCHDCRELGYIRPKCCKPLIKNNKQDLITHIRFLTNQISHLTQLTKIKFSSKKIWVKIVNS